MNLRHAVALANSICDSVSQGRRVGAGQPSSRREYYHAVGNGTRSNPNPPGERFCSAECFRWGLRRIAEDRARNTMVIEVSYL
jgi:hypothetical protein